jgi:cell division septation protein DedD
MMEPARPRSALLIPLLCSISVAVAAQEASEEHSCRPDEIDMGDYCAQKQPEAAQLKPGATRATPFRIKSMMPGHPEPLPRRPSPQATPAMNTPAMNTPAKTTPAADETPGFGVQLGVFSSRENAARVARTAQAAVGGDYVLARLPGHERILWACIQGPFPDEVAANLARRLLQEETTYQDAFVKPLDELELLELNDASTEK